MRAERRKVENTKCDFLRVFAWRPAMRKCENAKMKDKITTLQAWRVFAWRPFAPPCEDMTNRRRKGETWNVSYFRLAGRKVAMRKLETWWLFRVFAWRPFAPPGKDTTNRRRKGETWKVSYFRVAGRKVATRKHEKVTIWRVFAWRPFAFSPRKHDNTTWHKSATIAMACGKRKLLHCLVRDAYRHRPSNKFTKIPELVGTD